MKWTNWAEIPDAVLAQYRADMKRIGVEAAKRAMRATLGLDKAPAPAPRVATAPAAPKAPEVKRDKIAQLEHDARSAAESLAASLLAASFDRRRKGERAECAAGYQERASFAPPRPVAPTPAASDGMGHDASLVGIIDPRDERGIPVRDHGPRTAVRRTAGCTSLHRDRGTSRATFSGC